MSREQKKGFIMVRNKMENKRLLDESELMRSRIISEREHPETLLLPPDQASLHVKMAAAATSRHSCKSAETRGNGICPHYAIVCKGICRLCCCCCCCSLWPEQWRRRSNGKDNMTCPSATPTSPKTLTWAAEGSGESS